MFLNITLPQTPIPVGWAYFKKRITGADMDTMRRWRIGGTDLGIPYVLENGSIGYLFGDTFDGPWPGDPGWRSPVALRSAIHPAQGIVFDSAFKVWGDGYAPEIMYNQHDANDDHPFGQEYTVIPNDGISFPETGRQIISYMSINRWGGPHWRTNYAGLAYSDNGNDFHRIDVKFWNNEANTDPFQMWSMQRDGDYVYIISVRSGRQHGPMMLRRVRWDRMFYKNEYEGWGWNGQNWGWGRPCTPILTGRFGEPSLRKLRDGTWAMAYLNLDTLSIVTRTAKRVDGIWSEEKTQVSWLQESNLYGGFIHPWSTSAPNDLHLMVSTWKRDVLGRTTAYHVSHYVGTL